MDLKKQGKSELTELVAIVAALISNQFVYPTLNDDGLVKKAQSILLKVKTAERQSRGRAE